MTTKPSNAKVMLITGSVRRPSFTRAAVRAVQKALEQRGATTLEWGLREKPLPIADPEYHGDALHHPDPRVREFAEAASAANGFVIATPVYHNSFTGVLKNALDILGSAEFEGKPVGLVAHGSVQPLDQLRVVMRSVHGIATNQQLVTQRADFERSDNDYALARPQTLERVARFAEELLDWIERFRKD